MGARHDGLGGGDRAASHALNVGVISLLVARALGFTSINYDLIYGLPKQSVSSFTDTVERVLDDAAPPPAGGGT